MFSGVSDALRQEPITRSLYLPYKPYESTFARIFLFLETAGLLNSRLYAIQCNIIHYYMASSASGQDERIRALWMATRAGKMEPSCPLGTTRCIPQAKFPQKSYNKYFIDQVCSVKMTGYWPRSFFASLWTSTSSRSINAQKKNLANIQPSWPHTWSITHTYSKILLCHTVPLWSRYSGSIWSGYLGASMSHF